MASVSVEKLYELCEVIDNSANKSDCQTEFSSILSAVKSGSNEKRLAAQLIARYFHSFTDLRDQALDAMFELCEDDDVNIRKLVIKDLPSLCKEAGPHVTKITDVLVQLLQTDDIHEQQIVHSALTLLLKTYLQDTLTVLFGHILNVEEELIRERAVKFLALKLKTLPETILTKPIEEYVFQESKKVLQDVSGDEFLLFMHILSNLKHLQTIQGRQLLLGIVIDQADLEKPFDPEDPDRIDQLIHCMKQAIPFLSKNVPSTKFVVYMIEKVLPVLDSVQTADNASILDLMRLTVDLFGNCGNLDDIETKIEFVFNRVMDLLPIPPSEIEDVKTENDISKDTDEPKINFSELECFIWMLHQLTKKSSTFFTVTEENSEKIKEFKKRLQYLGRVIQVYSKKLKDMLSKQTKQELKNDANKIKVIALRTTSNISMLIKDFLRTTPDCKAMITPSWKTPEAKTDTTAQNSLKRSFNGTDNESSRPKISREDRKVYQPPSGKFSEKVPNYQPQQGSRGSWRGGGRGFGRRGRGYRQWY